MIAEEPGAVPDPRQDAYLGAVGQHLARRLLVESPLAFRR
jgi:hypothetical protein